MRTMMILGAAAIALAACSDSGGADKDGDGEITREEMAEELKSGGAVEMQPGKWEVTTSFSEFDAPGMSEQMRGMMAQQIGKGTTVTTCLTEEDVKDPGADFMGGDDDSCKFNEFDRSGNSMSVDMACTQEGGMTMNSKMEGSFGKDSYEMAIDAQMAGSPIGDIAMKGKVVGKRIGECDGDAG